jgi:hypothetical protein
MLWFFDRRQEVLSLETRYDNDTDEYVAIARYADGHQQTDRFGDAEQFRSWLVALEHTLERDHWQSRSGGPLVLPDGWPRKRFDPGGRPPSES